MSEMVTDKQVAEVLWTVRTLRVEGKPLSPGTVYKRQRYIFHYNQATVNNALDELSNRGYQWDKTFPGVPDSCIVIRQSEQA